MQCHCRRSNIMRHKLGTAIKHVDLKNNVSEANETHLNKQYQPIQRCQPQPSLCPHPLPSLPDVLRVCQRDTHGDCKA